MLIGALIFPEKADYGTGLRGVEVRLPVLRSLTREQLYQFLQATCRCPIRANRTLCNIPTHAAYQ